MNKVLTVLVKGQEVQAREMDFSIRSEPWNEYILLDGGRVRVKCVVQRILRVLDEEGNPKSNPDGTPQIVIVSANSVISSL